MKPEDRRKIARMAGLRKIARMAGLLFSDMDGEVVAAARAIRRTLEANKMSVHDFMDMIEQSKDPHKTFTNIKTYRDETIAMAQEILTNAADIMADHELRFVHDIKSRFILDEGYSMSEKQSRWFSYLYAKHGD